MDALMQILTVLSGLVGLLGSTIGIPLGVAMGGGIGAGISASLGVIGVIMASLFGSLAEW